MGLSPLLLHLSRPLPSWAALSWSRVGLGVVKPPYLCVYGVYVGSPCSAVPSPLEKPQDSRWGLPAG